MPKFSFSQICDSINRFDLVCQTLKKLGCIQSYESNLYHDVTEGRAFNSAYDTLDLYVNRYDEDGLHARYASKDDFALGDGEITIEQMLDHLNGLLSDNRMKLVEHIASLSQEAKIATDLLNSLD